MALLVVFFLSCSNDDKGTKVDCDSIENNLQLVNLVNPTCLTSGSVQIAGTTVNDYTFSLNEGPFQSDPGFETLLEGSYIITARSSTECELILAFDLNEEEEITLEMEIENSNCGDSTGKISLAATGGIGSYTYSIDGATYQDDAVFDLLAPGSYTILVKDEGSCVTSGSVEIITNVSFANDIMPIISNNCAISGCHMDAQSPLMNSAQEIIEQSGRINIRARGMQEGAQSMPPEGLIGEDLQEQINCWVLDGSLNN